MSKQQPTTPPALRPRRMWAYSDAGIASADYVKCYDEKYRPQGRPDPVLVIPADKQSVEGLREKIVESVLWCYDNGRDRLLYEADIADRVLSALGVTQPKRRGRGKGKL